MKADIVDVLIVGAGAAGMMCAIEAGKRGRREAADEAEHRARQAEAEGQADGQSGHPGQPGKSDGGPDEAIMGAREVEACIQCREPGSGQRLANALIADAMLEPIGDLGRAEQQRAEREPQGDPDRLGEHSHLD